MVDSTTVLWGQTLAYTSYVLAMMLVMGWRGMFVTIEGRNRNGVNGRVAWHIIARRGHGPFIPTISSVVLAKRLARREITLAGAMPCFDLFTLAEFMAEVEDLDIGWSVQ